MIWWLLLIIYVAGYPFAFVRLARAVAYFDDEPEVEDMVMGCALGVLFGFVWPLIALFMALRHVIFPDAFPRVKP